MRRREVIALLALSASAGRSLPVLRLASNAWASSTRAALTRRASRGCARDSRRPGSKKAGMSLCSCATSEAMRRRRKRRRAPWSATTRSTSSWQSPRPLLAPPSGPPRRSQSCSRPETTRSRLGLVDSIATPGGRLTGFHFLTIDLTAKRLEILREIVPKLRRVVTFYDPRNPTAVSGLADAREAARKLGIEVTAQQVTSPEEIRDRLRTLTAAEAEAFFFVADALVTSPHGAGRRGGKRPTPANHGDRTRSRQGRRSCELRA